MKTASQSRADSLRPTPTRTRGKPGLRSHRRVHGTGLAVLLFFYAAQPAVPHIPTDASIEGWATSASCAADSHVSESPPAPHPVLLCEAARLETKGKNPEARGAKGLPARALRMRR